MTDIDKAKEYFRKLKVLEKHCDGNTRMAKMILDGDLKDVVVLKGRFKDIDDETYGLITVFINKILPEITHTEAVVSHLASIYQRKPLEYWLDFYKSIIREKQEAEYNEGTTTQLSNALKRFVEIKGLPKILEWIEKNQIKELTDLFREIIHSILSIDDSTLLIDFELTSSIELYEKTSLDLEE